MRLNLAALLVTAMMLAALLADGTPWPN